MNKFFRGLIVYGYWILGWPLIIIALVCLYVYSFVRDIYDRTFELRNLIDYVRWEFIGMRWGIKTGLNWVQTGDYPIIFDELL